MCYWAYLDARSGEVTFILAGEIKKKRKKDPKTSNRKASITGKLFTEVVISVWLYLHLTLVTAKSLVCGGKTLRTR
jgi:hypothetical protein